MLLQHTHLSIFIHDSAQQRMALYKKIHRFLHDFGIKVATDIVFKIDMR